ncbi:MAG: DNA-binding protein WhiA [Clostridia bacterium]|nr:DNA-binding protein WhiA [Clostridia bacterium]
MSFTQNLKAQFATQDTMCQNCNVAELSAIIRLLSSYTKSGVVISTENEDVAERVNGLLSKVFKRNFEYTNRNGSFRLLIDGDFFSDTVAPRLMLFGDDRRLFTKECCRGSYIRGTFLAAGSVSDPKKQYHMEFDIKHKGYAEKLCQVLKRAGVIAKITERKRRHVVYIKEYTAIADTIGVMGAVGTAMEIYNISIEKEFRNQANRQSNCEVANIEKITKAASLQIEAIKKIEKKMGLAELPETLQEIARIRKEYPDESLKELGERLNPPIGKSGVNHRLKRIEEIAETL